MSTETKNIPDLESDVENTFNAKIVEIVIKLKILEEELRNNDKKIMKSL